MALPATPVAKDVGKGDGSGGPGPQPAGMTPNKPPVTKQNIVRKTQRTDPLAKGGRGS